MSEFPGIRRYLRTEISLDIMQVYGFRGIESGCEGGLLLWIKGGSYVVLQLLIQQHGIRKLLGLNHLSPHATTQVSLAVLIGIRSSHPGRQDTGRETVIASNQFFP